MSKPKHEFHLVDPSPLPIMSAISAFVLAVGGVLFIHKIGVGKVLFPLGLVLILSCMYSWWRDVIREGVVDKAHNEIVRKGLAIGMLLFILSEVMLFFSIFFSFFYCSIFPVHILDGLWPVMQGVWPPKNIAPLNAWDLPLLNTIILLLSGTTVTWAQHCLLENDRKNLLRGLLLTIILGLTFTCIQAYEYHHALFHFKDGIYPSNFYIATGFHGAHVIVGTIFLIVCYLRARKGDFAPGQGNLGLEFAAWYWHFVDVVWLFLFVFVYIWGS